MSLSFSSFLSFNSFGSFSRLAMKKSTLRPPPKRLHKRGLILRGFTFVPSEPLSRTQITLADTVCDYATRYSFRVRNFCIYQYLSKDQHSLKEPLLKPVVNFEEKLLEMHKNTCRPLRWVKFGGNTYFKLSFISFICK